MEEYQFDNQMRKLTILCCDCGTEIEPNPSNMCVGCLRNHVDISEGIAKQATLQFCRNCERYLQPPDEWVHAALESRELLSICLKKLKGLNRVTLVDAGFIWTEPHSKRLKRLFRGAFRCLFWFKGITGGSGYLAANPRRFNNGVDAPKAFVIEINDCSGNDFFVVKIPQPLKVKLTINAEVMGGTHLQQIFVVEFVVNNLMCNDCHRVEAKDYWRASVQVRQNSSNKKTFYYLEQLILKHKAHEKALGIKSVHEGLDFFFNNEATARKFVDFVSSVMPCRYQHSKKLISHDIRSNVYNYKFTFGVEMVPVSRDSVVCLPKTLTRQLGGISPICIIYKINNVIHIIDPLCAQIAEIPSAIFWRTPFNSICDPKQLILYYIMDIEILREKDKRVFPGQGNISDKHVVADVWVVKASELGTNMDAIHTRTHLGHLLNVGDYALGYALADTNINDTHYEKLNKDELPDVILIKKSYQDSRDFRKKRRLWKLKHLNDDTQEKAQNNADYDDFMEDLEEDADLRRDVRVYRDSRKSVTVDGNTCSNIPTITLDEMFDELCINDVEMQDSES